MVKKIRLDKNQVYTTKKQPKRNPPSPVRIPKAEALKSLKRKNIAFSFRFWEQERNFGLDKSTSSWFVAFFERIKQISGELYDDFIKNRRKQRYYGYHQINWNQTNIPIQRNQCTWVDSKYLDNLSEYPFFQMRLGMSFGGLIGFWDEYDVFNVVLLDPLHNIQPSKDYGYKVDLCLPADDDYTILLRKIENLNRKLNNTTDCPDCFLREDLRNLSIHYNEFGVLVVPLGRENYDKILQILSDKDADSIENLLEWGMVELEKNKNDN